MIWFHIRINLAQPIGSKPRIEFDPQMGRGQWGQKQTRASRERDEAAEKASRLLCVPMKIFRHQIRMDLFHVRIEQKNILGYRFQ